MSKQLTLLEYNNDYGKPRNDQLEILDLEKKYMNEILLVLKSAEFQKMLRIIEDDIKKSIEQGDMDHWEDSNPCAIAMERLLRFFFYTKWQTKVVKPYPNPISSDIAIELDDVIINIDSKTLSKKANPGDFKTLQIDSHQASFKNKRFFELPIPFRLKEKHNGKPCLSYVIKFHYTTNESSSFEGFKFYSSEKEDIETISLSCIPNGLISKFFKNSLVVGTKNYDDYKKKERKNRNLPKENPIIVENKNFQKFPLHEEYENEANFMKHLEQAIKEKQYYSKKLTEGIFEVNMSEFYPNAHFKYGYKEKNNNVETIYRFTKKGNSNANYRIELEPTKNISSRRLLFEFLEDRYDSSDNLWKGYQKIKLKELNELN